jgi:hypothetical protein
MGFGGGGTGSFSLPDHNHTNVLQDGGELDETVSLIDNGATVTLKAWIDAAIAAAIVAPTTQSQINTAVFSTSSTSLVDITGMSLTLPSNTGKSLVTVALSYNSNTVANECIVCIKDDTTDLELYSDALATVSRRQNIFISAIVENDGQAVKARVKSGSGAQTIDFQVGGNLANRIKSLEIN